MVARYCTVTLHGREKRLDNYSGSHLHHSVASVVITIYEWWRDNHHDGVAQGICNVFSLCPGRAVQTLSLWLDVSRETAMQRLDTETQIEDEPPLYRAWPPTSQNF